MDDLDYALIQILQRNARLPYTHIAKELNQPDTTIHFRARRLLRRGIISRFSALIDPHAIGLKRFALLSIRIGGHLIPELSIERTKTFATELSSQFHFLWVALGGEPMIIYAILLARDDNDLQQKVSALRKNPDVKSVTVTPLESITKGWELTGTPVPRE